MALSGSASALFWSSVARAGAGVEEGPDNTEQQQMGGL